ncbi:MAG: hypothetical protein E6Q73_13725 [Pseudorhodobacter sp.]|nr:MAG: hypothetical protein E6Q73_13725 [Pseudorhodobacter sp.]
MRDDIVLSYYRVRQALGLLGLSLPLLLIGLGLMTRGAVEPSLSDYYHTVQRDVFVGSLTAISLFLLAYPGHQRRPGDWLSDDALTSAAGMAGLGVAFFPNENPAGEGVLASPAQVFLGPQAAAIGHYLSALLFLTLLAVICLGRFARSAKPVRARIYRACGWTILWLTLAVLVASWFKIKGPAAPQAFVTDLRLILWFEAGAIWAFALAWLVKGRADLALARRLHVT